MRTIKVSSIITKIDQFDSIEFSKNYIGIEIQTFPQHVLDTDYEMQLQVWENKLQDFDGTVSIHGSSFDLNPGSTDKRIVDVTRERYLQSIEIADRLKATHVIFHSQVNPLLSLRRIRNMKLKNQVEFWIDLLDRIIPSNIIILIENEYDDTYEDMKAIVEGVNRSNFRVCLDIGHVLAYSQLDLESWFSGIGQYIDYIHLHWNDKTYDEHRPPTESELIELRELLRRYEISPINTMEYNVSDIYGEASRIRNVLEDE